MNEKGTRWHQATPQSVCQSLHTNAACGLSRKAARSRLKKQGRNPLFDDTAPKSKGYVKSLLLDPALLLMFFGALLAVVFLSFLQVFCTVILLVLLLAALGYFLYKCEEISRITAQYRTPTVRVLRDGRVFTVSAARVVVGDILLLHTGDVVPGDCRLLSAQQLRVLTLLPNEKGNPIYKECAKRADAVYPYGTHADAPLAENMLYGGSEILCGEARAVLVATGVNSYLGAMRTFALPAEIKERRGETVIPKVIAQNLPVWGLLSFILLAIMTIVGLFTTPNEGGLAEYFFILCVLIGASSPTVISLYLQWVFAKGRLLCMENNPKKNRAVIKSEAGLQKLASLTDLFVIGKRGLCDGVTHFFSAFVAGRELRPDDEQEKQDLQPLCEAMLLYHEADMRSPTYNSSSGNETDSAYLSELLSLCRFDTDALKMRLRTIERETLPNHPSWQSITATLQEGKIRFLFDSSGSLMRHCVLYEYGKRMRAITPEYRATLQQYCSYVEENGCRSLCVAKESKEGTLALVGILALREQVSAVLPSVVEELSQSGIVTRFFLSDDAYAHVCRLPEPYLYRSEENPNLTPALLQRYRTFIGFSKAELSALLPTYQKSGHRIAVLGGNADDRCFLRTGILTFACDTVTDLRHYAEDHIEEAVADDGREESHNTSQTIRRHADVIIERADRFFGGVYAALQTISHSRAVEIRTQMLLHFLLHFQLARLTMMFLAVCTGVGFFSSLQMFLAGFVVEILGVCFLADLPIPQAALRTPRVTDQKFFFASLFSKTALMPTLFSVGITALKAIILTFVGVLSKSAAQTYLFFSLFLLQICHLCRITNREKAKPDVKKIFLFVGVLVGTIVLLTLLSSLITSFGTVTGMGAWTLLTAILLPLSPAIYWILTLLILFLNRTAK